jgi:hypothetical protein
VIRRCIAEIWRKRSCRRLRTRHSWRS